MLISYNWLQSYLEERLPAPEKLAELITFSFAEIESAEKKGDDTIFDIKVLPDRACYALSHRGIAYEVAAITGIPLKKSKNGALSEVVLDPILMGIDEPRLCTKLVMRRIENLKVGPSPSWLREALEVIGQRSINNIVDVTNFVMLDIGRPTHVFDADKVKGKLTVRLAKKGETLILLDNKELQLAPQDLVIADDEGPVALGGIKGGKRTEVDAGTTRVILEAANWNPSYVRLAAARTGVRTEASKRFENRPSPLLAEEGSDEVTRLFIETAGTSATKAGKKTVISHEKVEERTLPVDANQISRKLGISLSEKEVTNSLQKLGIVCEKKGFAVTANIPPERLDLTIPEDLAEEVGRIIGYDKIPSALPPKSTVAEIPKSFYYEWKIRETLANAGFSEVMTSSFAEKGSVAIEKPLAEGKKYARPALRENFGKALKMNLLNAPLLGSDTARIFEIGKVFSKSGEHTALAIGAAGPKKSVGKLLEEAIGKVGAVFGGTLEGENKDGVLEINLDTVIAKLPEPRKWDSAVPASPAERFTPFSPYPFIVRDVALFVAPETKADSVIKIIKENAGNLVVRGPELFDEFEKGGKKSFAFRLVFQSFEHTLTDAEVNGFMEKVYSVLKTKRWEVR